MQTVTGEEEHEPETVDDDLQREFSLYAIGFVDCIEWKKTMLFFC